MTKSTLNGITVAADGNEIIINGKKYIAPADIQGLTRIDSDVYVECDDQTYVFRDEVFIKQSIPKTGYGNRIHQSVSKSNDFILVNSSTSHTHTHLTPFAKFLIIATVLGLLYWLLS